MAVSFSAIKVGAEYSRQQLARIWGYRNYYAIARGVVTPKNDNKIVLFVTQVKQKSSAQYNDKLVGSDLWWEAPRDAFGVERITRPSSRDEIHVFYRERHHSNFRYLGRARYLQPGVRKGILHLRVL